MCLVLFAHQADPRYALVLAANRDEFHARPAAPAAWIEPDVLAGRDLQAGGTWLALRRDGRFALVTNVRGPGASRPGAPSRGALPLQVVHDHRDLFQLLPELAAGLPAHSGCNLLAGSPGSLHCLSTHRPGQTRVAAGVHGLSNHALDTPWPKVARGTAGLRAWLTEDGEDPEALFILLGDRSRAADAQLPTTGVPLEWERRLSAAFIVAPDYGTRCSTVLLISRTGQVRLVERSFGPEGQATAERAFSFELVPPDRRKSMDERDRAH